VKKINEIYAYYTLVKMMLTGAKMMSKDIARNYVAYLILYIYASTVKYHVTKS
jgi:hypothetical protein